MSATVCESGTHRLAELTEREQTVEVVVDTAGTIQDMVVGWDRSLEGTGVHGLGQVEEGMAAAVMGEVEAAEVVGVDLLQ